MPIFTPQNHPNDPQCRCIYIYICMACDSLLVNPFTISTSAMTCPLLAPHPGTRGREVVCDQVGRHREDRPRGPLARVLGGRAAAAEPCAAWLYVVRLRVRPVQPKRTGEAISTIHLRQSLHRNYHMAFEPRVLRRVSYYRNPSRIAVGVVKGFGMSWGPTLKMLHEIQ